MAPTKKNAGRKALPLARGVAKRRPRNAAAGAAPHNWRGVKAQMHAEQRDEALRKEEEEEEEEEDDDDPMRVMEEIATGLGFGPGVDLDPYRVPSTDEEGRGRSALATLASAALKRAKLPAQTGDEEEDEEDFVPFNPSKAAGLPGLTPDDQEIHSDISYDISDEEPEEPSQVKGKGPEEPLTGEKGPAPEEPVREKGPMTRSSARRANVALDRPAEPATVPEEPSRVKGTKEKRKKPEEPSKRAKGKEPEEPPTGEKGPGKRRRAAKATKGEPPTPGEMPDEGVLLGLERDHPCGQCVRSFGAGRGKVRCREVPREIPLQRCAHCNSSSHKCAPAESFLLPLYRRGWQAKDEGDEALRKRCARAMALHVELLEEENSVYGQMGQIEGVEVAGAVPAEMAAKERKDKGKELAMQALHLLFP